MKSVMSAVLRQGPIRGMNLSSGADKGGQIPGLSCNHHSKTEVSAGSKTVKPIDIEAMLGPQSWESGLSHLACNTLALAGLTTVP